MSWLKMKTHFHTPCDKNQDSKKQIQVAFQAEHFVDLAQSFSEAILDSSSGCPRCGSRENFVEWLGDVGRFAKKTGWAKVRCLLRGRSTQEPGDVTEMSQNPRPKNWKFGFQGIRSNTVWMEIKFYQFLCRILQDQRQLWPSCWCSRICWTLRFLGFGIIRDIDSLSGFRFPTPTHAIPVCQSSWNLGRPSNNRLRKRHFQQLHIVQWWISAKFHFQSRQTQAANILQLSTRPCAVPRSKIPVRQAMLQWGSSHKCTPGSPEEREVTWWNVIGQDPMCFKHMLPMFAVKVQYLFLKPISQLQAGQQRHRTHLTVEWHVVCQQGTKIFTEQHSADFESKDGCGEGSPLSSDQGDHDKNWLN